MAMIWKVDAHSTQVLCSSKLTRSLLFGEKLDKIVAEISATSKQSLPPPLSALRSDTNLLSGRDAPFVPGPLRSIRRRCDGVWEQSRPVSGCATTCPTILDASHCFSFQPRMLTTSQIIFSNQTQIGCN